MTAGKSAEKRFELKHCGHCIGIKHDPHGLYGYCQFCHNRGKILKPTEPMQYIINMRKVHGTLI